jgi:hypothetical protein
MKDSEPLYYKKIRNYDIWQDGDGNRKEISKMETVHIINTISFLEDKIKWDEDAIEETCHGFINSMRDELNSR